jgi:hypothetical protein
VRTKEDEAKLHGALSDYYWNIWEELSRYLAGFWEKALLIGIEPGDEWERESVNTWIKINKKNERVFDEKNVWGRELFQELASYLNRKNQPAYFGRGLYWIWLTVGDAGLRSTIKELELYVSILPYFQMPERLQIVNDFLKGSIKYEEEG